MMYFKMRVAGLVLIAMMVSGACYAGKAQPLLERGWAALVRDNDTQALQYFGSAYLEAMRENDTAGKAEALLYLGICSYGASYSRGLTYAVKAMDVYKQLERTAPLKANEGRSRCLQLISTIKSRQGNYREAVALSTSAMSGLPAANDTAGSLGLIYNSLGDAYHHLGQEDSSVYFHKIALKEHLLTRQFAYLPNDHIQMADIAVAHNDKEASLAHYSRALAIADSMHNRQAQVMAMLGMARWKATFDKNYSAAEADNLLAARVAATLTDKAFGMKVLDQQVAMYKATGNYKAAMDCQAAMISLRDTMYSSDRKKELKSLEIQFDVAEKDRQLGLVIKEKEIATLTNWVLWGGIGCLALLSGSIIIMLRRINRRDRLLLQTQAALVAATEQQRLLAEEQKMLKERQMQQELEYKESQLSAMALQMLQKNELMQELKDKLEEDRTLAKDQSLGKIISKGLTQDKEWSDFNTHFESINKLFYTRLKQAYPDISPNDLRICALIKLHLSIKEMAAILNISPDSVKTARYRLRKKLQLNTEDNLVDFIAGL